jgi:hypothetical protein
MPTPAADRSNIVKYTFEENGFYRTLKRRAQEYFRTNNVCCCGCGSSTHHALTLPLTALSLSPLVMVVAQAHQSFAILLGNDAVDHRGQYRVCVLWCDSGMCHLVVACQCPANTLTMRLVGLDHCCLCSRLHSCHSDRARYACVLAFCACPKSGTHSLVCRLIGCVSSGYVLTIGLLLSLYCTTMSLSGATTTQWTAKHVIAHHIETNVVPVDDDTMYPMKRVLVALPRLAFHKYQHLYMWLIYLITIPLWTISNLVKVLLAATHYSLLAATRY